MVWLHTDWDKKSTNLFKQFAGWVPLWVPGSPSSGPDLECFILPNLKARRVHHSRLDNLLPWENTPCHCIHIAFPNIGYPAAPILVDSQVGQVRELLAFLNKCIQLCRRTEELQICLLIHITTRAAPSCSKSSVVSTSLQKQKCIEEIGFSTALLATHTITFDAWFLLTNGGRIRPFPVNRRLAIDCEEAFQVNFAKLFIYDPSLGLEAVQFWPRTTPQLAKAEFLKFLKKENSWRIFSHVSI